MFSETPDPLWFMKIVHPGFTLEDLRKLSEEPRAEGAGVFPAVDGPGKDIYESITVWNPQCEGYAFEELRFAHSYLPLPYSPTVSANLSRIASVPPSWTVGPKSHSSPPEKLASNALLAPAHASLVNASAPPKGIMGQPAPRGFMRD